MTPNDLHLALAGPSKARRLEALDRLEGYVDSDVSAILVNIENVRLDLVDYRNKELYLGNLSTLLASNRSEATETAAFHHLLGTLYINFEKFWAPTIRTLIDLVKLSKIRDRFLGYLIDNLVRTSIYIYDEDENKTEDSLKDRPDHVLHRNFILQILAKFPEYVERNSRTFMDQLFIFAAKELRRPPFIEKHSREDLTRSSRRHDDVRQVPKTRETMVTMFRIVQSFQSVSNMHRQGEFRDLIFELLACRDASVQKAAFNCLAVYNTDFIAPYMSKIMRLLDEKKAKSELSSFTIGSDSSHIQEDHRKELIPILHRILFGRMISKVDKKTAGRNKAESRKSIVMRYISGCTTEEILGFFAILFDPIYEHIDCPYEKLEQTLKNHLDTRNFIPLNKLQAMLTTLSAYLESVAHQKDETLPHLLKLINIITFYVVTPLEDDAVLCEIDQNCVETFKTLRRTCLNIITDFFQSSQYYQFSATEIDFIFKYIVWPSSRSFVDRNHAVITPILKLINSFAQNEVYHHLLLKKDPGQENLYLLQLIMILYNDSKITRPVSIYIAEMIARLLHINPEGEEEEVDERVQVMQIEQIDENLSTQHENDFNKSVDERPIGFVMVMKYVPIIFERLRESCERAIANKETNFRLEDCELRMLSTLSGCIKDSNQCMLAARLLLLTLDSQKKAHRIISTLRTVQELIKHVESPIDHRVIDYVANVLSYQRNIEQRKELCKLIENLAQRDSHMRLASDAIDLLNSMNEALVDQPDLEKWGQGFQVAFKYLDELDEVTVNDASQVRHSLVLLIHQIGYIINTIDKYEFSVRENCSIFYEKLAPKIALVNSDTNEQLIKSLLHDIILEKFIKKGFRETNDTIKHTYIGVARTLAVICHASDPVLGEFYLFCDKNQDLDFWLNIRHIQLHNRSRALARLVVNDNVEKLSPKTLSSYIMPLAAGFLFNKAYKSVASLSDNSIKLIGIICRHLNWMTYESTLSYYLGLLLKANATYQKTNIKLITEIVRNFNFDITACQEAMQHEDENRKLEKRMRRRCGEHSGAISDPLEAPLKPRRLNPSTARLVYHAVTKKLIPRLNSCLHEMTRVDFESSKNMADCLPEKDEIKRIPLAYAIVQLLNLLPCKYVLLRDHLPPLFLKLITFLKSKNEVTRKAARATLIRIMLFVGPTYVPDMLRILRQNLDKGFYVHVLNYTVHSVLSKLDLSYGDLDGSSHDIVNLCKQEIFGQASEDKEVAKVVSKTAEARKTTGYDTLEIIATHISADKLDNLVRPINELLKTTSDTKTVNKLAVCIQKIWNGLAQNEQFPLDALIEFIRNSIEESLPNLRVRHRVGIEKCNGSGPLREDRFLINKDKSKQMVRSKINEKGNLHMVLENSLRLLLSTFEKNKLKIKEDELLQQKLDDFIALLTTCLKSSSPRCVTRSLKCLIFIAQTRIDLPSFKTKSKSIVKKIFILLSLYNGVGMVQGDNYDMIAMCFKTLTFLLLKCEHVHLEPKQIGALVSYIEQDLNDVSRQATAFNALNSILHKRCECPQLASVMDKVADLLVSSCDDSVRSLSVKIWQTYLLEYKLETPKLQNHMSKFLRQIDYEYIDGRKSVLKMLQVIVEKFPERLLRAQFELFFHLLAQRVVNDESKEIRATVGRIIAQLLQRLPETQDIVIAKFVFPWSSSSNMELRMLGVKLLSILIEANRGIVEKNVERMNSVLAIVIRCLDCTNQKKGMTIGEKETNEQEGANGEMMVIDENSQPQAEAPKQVRRVTVADKLAYHALRLFKRLLAKELIGFTELRYLDQLKKIWQDLATDKLAHWHEPVISTACELYLLFVSKTPLNQALVERNSNRDEYINRNAIRIVKLLCNRFLDLMDKFEPKTSICKYAMQGLIVLGQMVANSEATHGFERQYSEAFGGSQVDILEYMLSLEALPDDGFVHERLPYLRSEASKRVDLMWLSVKVVMQARKEAAIHRLSATYRREFVLRWLAAIAQELGPRRIITYVFLFLMTPVRELTDKVKLKDAADAEQKIVPLAQDLLKFIKGLVGVESFNKVYPKVQLYYTKKRVDRKKNEAISRVKDQAGGVKRRLKAGRKKRAAATLSNKRKRLA